MEEIRANGGKAVANYGNNSPVNQSHLSINHTCPDVDADPVSSPHRFSGGWREAHTDGAGCVRSNR